jgi:hypothetical protein
MLVAKKEGVVIFMADYQQDTNTSLRADKLLLA